MWVLNAGSDWVWLHEPMVGHWGVDWAVVIGGRVPSVLWPLNPPRWLWGRDRRSKVRPCQLMRHCTPVWSRGPYGWTEADDGLKRMWLRWRVVTPPTQEMRWALVWAVWQNGLEVFVCVLALRKLCGLIGMIVGFQWTSSGQSALDWEWWSLRHRVVLYWTSPGPSLLVHWEY